MAERKGDWMTTYTGQQFWPLDPRPEDIDLTDIAHALSLQCRFAGHCRYHYSIAEHSLLVASIVSEIAPNDETLKAALLHDASEAYLTDIPRPLKRQRVFEEYRAHERIMQAAIWERFGIEEHAIDHETIEVADAVALLVEMKELMPAPMIAWADGQKKRLDRRYHTLVETTQLPKLTRTHRTLTDIIIRQCAELFEAGEPIPDDLQVLIVPNVVELLRFHVAIEQAFLARCMRAGIDTEEEGEPIQ
jgi:uncharacterized protein